MILFIITRVLDVITTLLNVREYGNWDIELNPTMRWLGDKSLFLPYQAIIIILTILVIGKLKHKETIYRIYSYISLVMVFINLHNLVNY